jgi:hypothetical protein
VISQLFSLIKLILGAFQLWDAFVQLVVDERDKEREKDAQARDAAIEESKKEGQSDDDIFKNQGDIVSHLPKP